MINRIISQNMDLDARLKRRPVEVDEIDPILGWGIYRREERAVAQSSEGEVAEESDKGEPVFGRNCNPCCEVPNMFGAVLGFLPVGAEGTVKRQQLQVFLLLLPPALKTQGGTGGLGLY